MLILVGCKSREQKVVDSFGEVKPKVTEAQVQDLLKLARAQLSADVAPKIPEELSKIPPRRVMLKAYHGGRSTVATALGDNLADSVLDAAVSLKANLKDPKRSRLELAVVTRFASVKKGDESFLPSVREVGTEGYLASDGKNVGFVLPSEVITQELWQGRKKGMRMRPIHGLLAKRAKVKRAEIEDKEGKGTFFMYSFKAISAVESRAAGKTYIVQRGLPDRSLRVNAQALRQTARNGADYLVKSQREDGSFIYLYNPTNDKEAKHSSAMAQVETGLSLLTAYSTLKDDKYKVAAEKSLAWTLAQLQDAPEGTVVTPELSGFKYLKEEKLSKSGAAAEALLLLVRHAAVTGDKSHLGDAEALGKFLVHMQRENGSFGSFFPVPAERPSDDREQYTGLVMYALLELNALSPNKVWSDAALKSAAYVVDVRDVAKEGNKLSQDPWLVMGLVGASRTSGDARFGEFALKMGDAILKLQMKKGKAPRDFTGGFYAPPLTGPAAERLLALCALATWSRERGQAATELVEAARAAARFLRDQQWDSENSYFISHGRRVQGAWREGFASNKVRIDYTHKSVASFLWLAVLVDEKDQASPAEPADDSGQPETDGAKEEAVAPSQP